MILFQFFIEQFIIGLVVKKFSKIRAEWSNSDEKLKYLWFQWSGNNSLAETFQKRKSCLSKSFDYWSYSYISWIGEWISNYLSMKFWNLLKFFSTILRFNIISKFFENFSFIVLCAILRFFLLHSPLFAFTICGLGCVG